MRLVRYNPFRELDFWGNSFDNFFKTATESDGSWYPAVDILDEKESIVLNIELAGVKKEDISIDIKNRVLSIKGERKFENKEKKESYFRKERSYGCFERSFTLSEDVLTDDVIADFKDGVLKVCLKKNKTKEDVRQITIN